jgi:hypothetical protein
VDPRVDVDVGEISVAPYQDSKSGSSSLWPRDDTDYKNNESRIYKHFNFRIDILVQRNGGLVPDGDKGVSSYTQRPDRPCGPPVLQLMGIEVYVAGARRYN